MKSFADRVLQAYRPLYQRGLLMDGQYKLPSTDSSAEPARPAGHKRMWLVALCGLLHIHPSRRSSS